VIASAGTNFQFKVFTPTYCVRFRTRLK